MRRVAYRRSGSQDQGAVHRIHLAAFATRKINNPSRAALTGVW